MAEFWINHIAIRSHGCQQHQQRQQQQNWKIIFVLLGRRKRRCGNSLSWVDDIWLLIFSHIFGVFILLDRHNDGMLQKIFLSPDLIPPHNWSSTTFDNDDPIETATNFCLCISGSSCVLLYKWAKPGLFFVYFHNAKTNKAQIWP